jgi:hypothetical protein
MSATLTAPQLDLDAAGLQLVAEVESYLRSVATPPPAPAAALLAPTVCRYGQVVQAWHAGIERPEPSLLDRIRSRHPVAEVTVAQHLDLVSRYIHAHGWLQGSLWDDRGAVCILGAQLRILQAGFSTPAVVEQARLHLGNELGHRGEGQPLDTWNDAEGRRVADVHQLLQRAATRAR